MSRRALVVGILLLAGCETSGLLEIEVVVRVFYDPIPAPLGDILEAMRWGLVVLVGLAACGGKAGVDLEVRANNDAIKSVEVFVATSTCYDENNRLCDGVTWMPDQQPQSGLVYLSDTEEDVAVEPRILAPNDNGTFGIRLTAEGDLADTKLIVVVGYDDYDGRGFPIGVATLSGQRIPENSAVHWTVDLEEAAAAVADPPSNQDLDPRYRVAVWGREGTVANPEAAGGARCLVVQTFESTWRSTFVVPASDHDCDGWVDEMECSDEYVHLNETADASPKACVGVASGAGNNGTVPLDGACMLGHTACRDGTSSTDPKCSLLGVEANAYTCGPDAVCANCKSPYPLASCIDTQLTRANTTHLDCALQGMSSGAACPSGATGTIASLRLPFDCPQFEIYGANPVADRPLDGALALLFPIDQAYIEVSKGPYDPCEIFFKFKTGTAVIGSKHWFLVAAHPYGDERRIVVPFNLQFETGSCAIAGGNVLPTPCTGDVMGDNMVRCAGLMPQ